LSRRRRTLIAFFSVSFGIAMLIVLGAIMVGVNDTMIKNAVALQTGHLSIEAPVLPFEEALSREDSWEQTVRDEAVEALLPRLVSPAMLRNGKMTQTLQVTLVEPQREVGWSPLPNKIHSGTWLNEEPGLVIGASLSDRLAVSVGDTLELLTAKRRYQLPVLGIFKTGIQALDHAVGYMAISVGRQEQLDVHVQLRTALFAKTVTDLVELRQNLKRNGLQEASVYTWQTKLPELEQLVKLNEFSMQIMIALVIAILAFGVANSLLISVMDRYRYYGILKAIGVRPVDVVVTFVGEALVICLGACVFGTLVGVVISLLWGQVGLDISHYTSYNPHFSINPMIYPRLVPSMVFLPQGLALMTGVLASIWPALVAARRRVSSTMRDL